ncbi:MAG: pantoate--beta-alanine ligase [Steroidobacteraceae bacterium]|nr:pantoate--beta-alanine ligase [Nevskiaceae bacterium]MCP5359767.1 pantoate--beta-alanine ligase [Nevskiaceae bacterium]MCP5472743.1 pantoate--beta-alanine ligase [Nevskiaceae bacterium]
MDIVTTIAAVRERVAAWRAAGEQVAFVPTMGNLHAGHISLIELARRHGQRFVASIFVNPMQFGPNEDFNHYPRTPGRDAGMLAEAGCDLMFQPDVAEMYPSAPDIATRVEVPGLSTILCGEFRPGHFEGVATVVAKLFNIVQPDVAVFGEKDFQQLTVIRRMVADLCLPVRIVGAPTMREADGLAMSSRNQYLDATQRGLAPRLYAELQRAVAVIEGGGRDFAALESAATARLAAAGFQVDYFAVRRAADLQLPQADDAELVALVAARLGRARLIDNLRIVAGPPRTT